MLSKLSVGSTMARRTAVIWLAAAILSLSSLTTVAATGQDLIDAASEQDWEAVRSYLSDQDVNVNATQPDGATALSYAVYRDNVDIARELLDAGADPNIANVYDVTPLYLAAENRSEAMVKLLLDAGADPNVTNWSGESVLMNTARTGFIEAMQMLIDHGADINFQDPRRQQSALMWSISYGHPEASRLLIENGADVNARTIRLNEDFSPLELEGYGASIVHAVPQGGYTPLIFAAVKGDVQTAKLLIENGADVNAVSETDGSPLVIAAAQGNEDFALYLLDQGADPNATDANGMAALHYALRTGIKALHGLYTTEKDMVCNFGGENYLCRPYETLNEEQLAYLADPDSEVYVVKPKPYDRSKALPGPNMNRLVVALLDKGANPNAKMKYPPAALRLQRTPWFSLENATPFFLAAAGQDLEAISILLEEGAEPMVETEMPQALYTSQTSHPAEDNMVVGDATTLMAAVGMGRRSDLTLDEEERALEIAKILISLGADVNEHSRSGWTALHAAAFLGSDKLVRFLVEQGAEIDAMTGCGRTPISLALADKTDGMLDRTLPRIETAELLLELGAGNKPPVGPLGECIGGRGGLEADEGQNELVRNAIQAVKARLEERKSNWQSG